MAKAGASGASSIKFGLAWECRPKRAEHSVGKTPAVYGIWLQPVIDVTLLARLFRFPMLPYLCQENCPAKLIAFVMVSIPYALVATIHNALVGEIARSQVGATQRYER